MNAFEWAITFFLLLHAVIWPQTSENIMVQKLRERLRPMSLALGLSHSWHMFCQTDWTHTARLRVEVKDEKGQTIRVIEPQNYKEKKWFAELAMLTVPPPSVLKSMLEFHQRNASSDASRFVLVKTLGRRPETPAAWLEKFGTEPSELRSITVAQLIFNGTSWKFSSASTK